MSRPRLSMPTSLALAIAAIKPADEHERPERLRVFVDDHGESHLIATARADTQPTDVLTIDDLFDDGAVDAAIDDLTIPTE